MQKSVSGQGFDSVYKLRITLYCSFRGYPALSLCDHSRIGVDCSNSAGEYAGVDQPFADQRGSEGQVLLPPSIARS